MFQNMLKSAAANREPCHFFPIATSWWNLVITFLVIFTGCKVQATVLTPEPITALALQNGTLWIGTDKALARYDYNRRIFLPVGLAPVSVTALAALSDGLVVGTARGVFFWSTQPESHLVPIGIDIGVVRSLSVIGGVVWIGSSRGLFRWNGSSGDEIKHIGREIGEVFGIASFEGTIWIGSSEGLARYQPSFEDVAIADSQLEVTALNAGSSTLWISTSNQGLYYWEDRPLPLQQWLDPNIGTIKAVTENKQQLWIATDRGLFRWDHAPLGPIYECVHFALSVTTVLASGNSVFVGGLGGLVVLDDNSQSGEAEVPTNLGAIERAWDGYLHRRYSQSIFLFESVLRQYPDALGAELPKILDTLAVACAARSDWGTARQFLEKAQSYLETSKSQTSFLYAAVLRNLGTVDLQTGRSEAATTFFVAARAIGEDATQHFPEITDAIDNEGAFWAAQNYIDKAYELYRQSLRIDEMSHPPDSNIIAVRATDVASALSGADDDEQALVLLKRALSIYNKKPQTYEYDIADVLFHLGYVLYHEDKWKDAEAYFVESARIQHKYSAPGELLSRFMTGRCEVKLGEASGVEDLLMTFPAYIRGYGEDGPGLWLAVADIVEAVRESDSRLRLAVYAELEPYVEKFSSRNGRRIKAQAERVLNSPDNHVASVTELRDVLVSANSSIAEELAAILPTLSIGQQLPVIDRLLSQNSSATLQSLDYGVQVEDAYPWLLNWKGVWTELLRWQHGVIAVADPDIRTMAADLQSLRATIVTELNHSNDPERIAQLVYQKEHLEQEIQQRALPQLSALLTHVTIEDIQRVLDRGEALIDVYYARQEKRLYAIITRKTGVPKLVKLPSKTIVEDLRHWRVDVLARKDSGLQWKRIQDELWTPIQTELGAATTAVWVCPDGALSNIPWQLLQDGHRLEVALLTSPRDIFYLRRGVYKHSVGDSMLDISDVKYESALLDESTRPEGAGFEPLPEASEETRSFRRSASHAGVRFQQLGGLSATKANVLEAMSRAQYIHFSTHGYFSPYDFVYETTFHEEFPQLQSSTTDFSGLGARDPLAESGIALSGANDSKSSGILSAEEVLDVDLKNSLVVLAACETALGRDFSYQGVIGFRAAFLAAGASSVIMSTWEVPDAATSLLMREFYRNMWVRRMPVSVALLRAQEALRSSREFKSPINWAGWVLVGAGW